MNEVAEMTIPLTICNSGETVEVVAVESDSILSDRLRAMGMTPGTRMIIHRAGSPMIVQIGETRFCLRGDEAFSIFVQPIYEGAPADGGALDAIINETQQV